MTPRDDARDRSRDEERDRWRVAIVTAVVMIGLSVVVALTALARSGGP